MGVPFFDQKEQKSGDFISTPPALVSRPDQTERLS